MILTVDNELFKFQIKRLQQEIEKQMAEYRLAVELKLRYEVVNEAWGNLYLKGVWDERLYKYKVELERAILS